MPSDTKTGYEDNCHDVFARDFRNRSRAHTHACPKYTLTPVLKTSLERCQHSAWFRAPAESLWHFYTQLGSCRWYCGVCFSPSGGMYLQWGRTMLPLYFLRAFQVLQTRPSVILFAFLVVRQQNQLDPPFGSEGWNFEILGQGDKSVKPGPCQLSMISSAFEWFSSW